MARSMRVALAGDTMLGRGVGEALRSQPLGPLVSTGVREVLAEADLFLLNLECCISESGEPWPDPDKPFFFRAPPVAAEVLANLGVDVVTLANNHALDFGAVALLDTIDLLVAAGVAVVGAGRDAAEARGPVKLERAGSRLGIVACTDHPRAYAAGEASPGVAYADLRAGLPDWLTHQIRECGSDAVLVTPHWGPNMADHPVPHVRRAAEGLIQSGATLVAGHSAHVFHGVTRRVIFDLGDFVDDYATDPILRNDLGMLFLVDLSPAGAVRLEGVPLALDYCHTRLASGEDAEWVHKRFGRACAEMGTTVATIDGRSVVVWDEAG